MTQLGHLDELKKVMDSYIADNEKLLLVLMELIYFYRGALSYEEAMAMSPTERDLAFRFINKRLEHASKMPNPVF
jgi:hypothetical protein